MNNTDDNLPDNIVSSYIDFVNTTNTSIHSMIEIINSQQSSFNQILNRYNIYNYSRLHRRRQPIITQYYPYNNYHNIYRQNTNTNTNTSRTNNQQRPYNLGNIFGQIFNSDTQNNFSEPVIVRPTYLQIINATNKVLFESIQDPLNNSCPISQLDFSANTEVIQLIHCKHIFMPTHILQWFDNHVICPLCRYDIRNNGTPGEPINNGAPEENVNNRENRESINNVENEENVNNRENRESVNNLVNQLAAIISNQLTSDADFSGNINIELSVDPERGW